MPSQEHGAVQPNVSAFRWEVLLSERLRAGAIPRLDTREAPARPLTLEGIQAKLLAAAQRRESMKRTRSGRELAAPVSASDVARHRRQHMEERLASAAANRQQRLAAVVAAAARRHSEVHSRCRALKERQGQLAARLETHLQQAEAARVARLAQTSARAGQAVARVREAAAEARVREGMQAARLKLSLLQRLQRADHSRQEALQAMLAGQARGGGAGGGAAAAGSSPYLARHATKRAQLRRQCSSRKVQAAWRAFTAHRQTTRALAAGFAATGVPFTVPLQPDSTPEVALRGHSNTSSRGPPSVATLRVPAGQSAGASPFGTPDPCSSPTSTVRRPDGRLQSAPVSITHTPHTTPNRTPGPSAAGSPTRLARRAAYTAATASGGAPTGSTTIGSTPTTAAARDSPLPAAALPTTPQAPAMPPLRSIGSPASAPLPASHAQLHPGAGGFEQLAAAISAPATLKAARALLQRLESRASLKGVSAGCCAGLLRRLFPRGNPPPRPQASSAAAGAAGISRARAAGQQVPPQAGQQRGQAGGERARQAPQQGGQQAPLPPQQERYPARVFLCAYMLLSHPEVVFSSRGEREAALSSTAAAMVAAFEALLGRLLEPAEGSAAEGSAAAGTTTRFGFGSVPSATGGVSAGAGAGALSAAAGAAGRGEASGFLAAPLAALLQRFDEAWVAYLEQFVAWKSADAAGLETELIRVAVELESSRLAKLAGRPAGGPGAAGVGAGRLRSEEDMEAIVAGVDHDLHLIAERVQRLTGAQGAARLAAALAAARAAAAAAFSAQLRQEQEEGEAGGSMSAGTAGSQSSSPGRSPARKVHRSRGQYSSQSTGGTAVGGATEAGFALPGPLPSTSLPGGSPSLSPSSSPPPPSSASSSALTAALRQEAAAAVDMDALLAGAAGANLALMWQLLHDPAWRLPATDLEAAWLDALGETDPLTEALPSSEALAAAAAAGGEQLRALVGGRVKRIAERAFWDSVQEKLCAAGPTSSATATASTPQAAAAEQVAGLLAGLGVQLGEVLPAGSSEAQEVAARLDQASLLQALLPGSGTGTLDVPALLSLLDWSAGLLARLGAPARDAAAAHAQAVVRAQLAAAGGEGGGVAAAAVRALRLLSVQLKLLRLDAGNAQLGMLAAQLTSQGTAAYATAKLEALLGPAQGVSEECLRSRLPHTRAWLAAASGQLPQLELQHLDPPSPVQQQQQQQRQELPALRSGLGPAQAGSQPLLQQQQQQQRLQLLVPVALHSWRGLVRLGLVQLVAGEGAAAGLPLPETLRLDSGRLHAAQAEFQRLQVMAACLLLCRQGAAAGLTFGPPELAAAKRRLAALLADPAMRLADLAAEVACLAGGQGGAAREAAVQDSISRMLGRGGAAMKALTSGFSTALLAQLLLGSASSDAQQQASLALRRCGGGDLEAEVGALAGQLAGLAAVGEGVSGQWHRKLSSDLL